FDFPSVATLYSDRGQPGSDRFVFVPGSATDEVDGPVLVKAAGPLGVLCTVHFTAGERGKGLDIQAPVVVEGVLAAGRAVEYTPPHRSRSARAVPPMRQLLWTFNHCRDTVDFQTHQKVGGSRMDMARSQVCVFVTMWSCLSSS